jgi:hypothetical protein
MDAGALLTWDDVDSIAGETFNVFQDNVIIDTGVNSNSYNVSGLTNNSEYSFSVSWVHPSGEESNRSEEITVIPQAETVVEIGYDDGTAEEGLNLGSQSFTAVHFKN